MVGGAQLAGATPPVAPGSEPATVRREPAMRAPPGGGGTNGGGARETRLGAGPAGRSGRTVGAIFGDETAGGAGAPALPRAADHAGSRTGLDQTPTVGSPTEAGRPLNRTGTTSTSTGPAEPTGSAPGEGVVGAAWETTWPPTWADESFGTDESFWIAGATTGIARSWGLYGPGLVIDPAAANRDPGATTGQPHEHDDGRPRPMPPAGPCRQMSHHPGPGRWPPRCSTARRRAATLDGGGVTGRRRRALVSSSRSTSSADG